MRGRRRRAGEKMLFQLFLLLFSFSDLLSPFKLRWSKRERRRRRRKKKKRPSVGIVFPAADGRSGAEKKGGKEGVFQGFYSSQKSYSVVN